jgi:hypothetical protein
VLLVWAFTHQITPPFKAPTEPIKPMHGVTLCITSRSETKAEFRLIALGSAPCECADKNRWPCVDRVCCHTLLLSIESLCVLPTRQRSAIIKTRLCREGFLWPWSYTKRACSFVISW